MTRDITMIDLMVVHHVQLDSTVILTMLNHAVLVPKERPPPKKEAQADHNVTQVLMVMHCFNVFT